MADAVKELTERYQTAERELLALKESVALLQPAPVTPIKIITSTSAEELEEQNSRLRYQILHLKRSVSEYETMLGKCMVNVRQMLNAQFLTALKRAFPLVALETENVVHHNSQPKFGDYKFVSSMKVSQALKELGEHVPPAVVAQKVMDQLPSNDHIKSWDIAGPGFVNIFLQPSFVSKLVTSVLLKGAGPPMVQPRRVVIDFSSPNIAKEMHVGHLRSTIIGETLSRLLEFVGHDVLRLNHVGDWGTQFGMLIAHLKDTFPNYRTESPAISDLQTLYKASKKRFDQEEDFKKRAYEDVVKLQSGDKDVVRAWQLICDVSRKEFSRIYKRLGVTLIERGESFYNNLMGNMVKELEARNLLRKEAGCKLLFVPGHKVPLTLVKSDGGFTYDTSDMAAMQQRLQEEKGEWLIYVVDSGQSLHFDTVFAAGQLVGWYDQANIRVDHVGFGVVLGTDKKRLKTRSGETVRLSDLLDEGIERAAKRLQEKERDKVLSEEELVEAKEAVAYGCIKYSDLSHDRINDYVFSFDKMLDDRGNTAVYLLYAYTRIKSIARTANLSRENIVQAATTTEIELVHEKELKLAKAIIRFPDVVCHVLEDLRPHVLCEYTYELCTTFSEFYDNCYCIQKAPGSNEIININMSRVLLCEATAAVLEKAFYILGLKPVHKM